ncbi:MAG: hypothetical protein AB7H86_13880 [Blastocatellales bacterium]
MREDSDQKGAGGTPGGLGEFMVGLGMASVGAYLLTNNVTVSSGYWYLWGYNAFGLTLFPLMIGIGILFFNGRSGLGWAMVVLGTLIIFAGILANLDVYFRPTSLFNTVMMIGLLAGGIGLVARSLKSH